MSANSGMDINKLNVPKATSYEYGKEYQNQMEVHYWESKNDDPNNHDRARIALAEMLIKRHYASSGTTAVLLDVGCSVGLFATHFSKMGYRSIGVDFDKDAVEIAQKICKIDSGSAEFITGDLGDPALEIPPVDIAICFDIFEHLHDDELGVLLTTLKSVLKPNGVVIFHTLPMQYDYIFWNGRKGQLQIPILLMPFIYFSNVVFEKAVRCYALFMDVALVLFTNRTWRERIKRTSHCNPLTRERLEDIFLRGGWEVVELKTGFLTNQFKESLQSFFERRSITHRSLYGVCRITKSASI